MAQISDTSNKDNTSEKYRRRRYEQLSVDIPISDNDHYHSNNNNMSFPQQLQDNDVLDEDYGKDKDSVTSLLYESYQKEIWEPLFGTLPGPYGSRRPENKLIFAVAALILLTITFFKVFVSLPAIHFQSWSHHMHQKLDYKMAFEESDGFFDDISSNVWMAKKKRFKDQPRHNDKLLGLRSDFVSRDTPQIWYQNNWDSTFTCPHERRIGGTGDGGKWICDPHRITSVAAARPQNNGCLIYSFGENSILSLSFEEELHELLGKGCEIHFFDHSLGENSKYSNKKKLPDGILKHSWGLEAKDDAHLGRRNYLTLQETVTKLGHEGREVDILKLNCQACEWKTYKEWLSPSSGLKSIRQIIVELHGTPHIDDHFF